MIEDELRSLLSARSDEIRDNTTRVADVRSRIGDIRRRRTAAATLVLVLIVAAGVLFTRLPGKPETLPAGAPVGRLRATLVEDHLHLSVLDVVASERRKGLATVLVGAAAGWGLAHGARWAVLQVALHNAGAGALYGRLGFVEHHRYRYLVPPA